ncbi:MAG: Flp pilus assembly protein CpaB [Nocardioides sp.]
MGRRTILLLVALLIAALGTAMILLYVKGIDDRATEGQTIVEVLVAKETIELNELADDAVAAGKFETIEIPQVAKADGALSSVKPIEGLVALGRILPGEQILSAKFGVAGSSGALPIPTGKIAVSVELTNPARVAGFVTNGSEVAIFASSELKAITEEGDEKPLGSFTRLFIDRATVIGVGDTTIATQTKQSDEDSQGGQTTEDIPRTIVTLAVTQEQAELIQHAAHFTDLSFALLTKDSAVNAGRSVNAADVFPDIFKGLR